VRRDVDLDAMAKGRLQKAERALGALQPFLATQAIPLMMRAMVVKTVLLASVLHGAEVWGMSKERCKPAQALVNQALRLLCGCKRSDMTVSVAAMWRELQVPPVHALASARRARALVKYPTLKTWIATVLKYPVSGQGGPSGWAAASRRWLKINALEVTGEGNPSPRVAYKEVLRATWEKMEMAKDDSAGAPYRERGFQGTSWAAVKAIPAYARREQISLGRGLRAVSMCRLGAFYTARKLARLGLIHRRYETQCPCCGEQGEGETVEHLLLRCDKWDGQREEWLGGMLGGVPKEGREDRDICTIILGGEHMGTRLVSWLPMQLEQGTHDGERVQCGVYQVARFLESIASARNPILRQLGEVPPRRAKARKGRAHPA